MLMLGQFSASKTTKYYFENLEEGTSHFENRILSSVKGWFEVIIGHKRGMVT